MRKDIKNIFKISSVYVGTILGAGFATGQEINQFFLIYGYKSIYGILISGLLFMIIGIIVLNKIYSQKIYTYDKYINLLLGKRLGKIFEILAYLFMVSSFFIMIAGSGAFFHQQFSINKNIGIVIMALLCLLIFLKDAKGIIIINSILTPIMITATIILGIYIIKYNYINTIGLEDILKKSLHNWLTSSILYVSYNTLTIGIVMVTMQELLTKRKIAIMGGIIGGGCLLICAIILWTVIKLSGIEANAYEIPILHIAMQNGNIIKYSYTFILYSAMLTTAVANGYGVLYQINKYFKFNKKYSASLFCILSIPFAKLGFANLVRNLYSFFGYLGLLMLIIVLIDGIKELKYYKKDTSRYKTMKSNDNCRD